MPSDHGKNGKESEKKGLLKSPQTLVNIPQTAETLILDAELLDAISDLVAIDAQQFRRP